MSDINNFIQKVYELRCVAKELCLHDKPIRYLGVHQILLNELRHEWAKGKSSYGFDKLFDINIGSMDSQQQTIDDQKKVIKELLKVCEFYANKDNWMNRIASWVHLQDDIISPCDLSKGVRNFDCEVGGKLARQTKEQIKPLLEKLGYGRGE